VIGLSREGGEAWLGRRGSRPHSAIAAGEEAKEHFQTR